MLTHRRRLLVCFVVFALVVLAAGLWTAKFAVYHLSGSAAVDDCRRGLPVQLKLHQSEVLAQLPGGAVSKSDQSGDCESTFSASTQARLTAPWTRARVDHLLRDQGGKEWLPSNGSESFWKVGDLRVWVIDPESPGATTMLNVESDVPDGFTPG